MIDPGLGQSYLANYSTYWKAAAAGDTAELLKIRDSMTRAWPGDTRQGMAPRDLQSYESALAVLDSNIAGSRVTYHPPGAGSTIGTMVAMPPLPHPDASNQTIGPNLGGADGVSLPGDGAKPAPPGSPATGLLVVFGGLALLLLLLRKK